MSTFKILLSLDNERNDGRERGGERERERGIKKRTDWKR